MPRTLLPTPEDATGIPAHHNRRSIAAMFTGLALTIVAILVPYVDRADLVGHIRAGYPQYSTDRIDTAADAYLLYLTSLGLLGVLCWLTAIWAVAARKRWARWAAVGILTIATAIALFDVLIKDTSGEIGLPPLLGWIGLLPCLAGLVAVLFLQSRRNTDLTES